MQSIAAFYAMILYIYKRQSKQYKPLCFFMLFALADENVVFS